jgi:hypothetical protein
MWANRLALGCITLLLSAASAFAVKGCYSASYDKDHFKSFPGQTPNFLSINLFVENGYQYAEISAKLRGSKTNWVEVAVCEGKADTTKCDVECDGGGFELKRTTLESGQPAYILINTKGFRVGSEACPENETSQIEPVPGNRRFTLVKSKEKDCE